MVKAISVCNRVLATWNGVSRLGKSRRLLEKIVCFSGCRSEGDCFLFGACWASIFGSHIFLIDAF